MTSLQRFLLGTLCVVTCLAIGAHLHAQRAMRGETAVRWEHVHAAPGRFVEHGREVHAWRLREEQRRVHRLQEQVAREQTHRFRQERERQLRLAHEQAYRLQKEHERLRRLHEQIAHRHAR